MTTPAVCPDCHCVPNSRTHRINCKEKKAMNLWNRLRASISYGERTQAAPTPSKPITDVSDKAAPPAPFHDPDQDPDVILPPDPAAHHPGDAVELPKDVVDHAAEDLLFKAPHHSVDLMSQTMNAARKH